MKKNTLWNRRWSLLSATVLLATAGCMHSRQHQLERVAKDWCSTIRASQVIPVYPLTEDLQPGDIFLVESPIVDQRRLYQSRGYLPFENHLGRLLPDYSDFYSGGYDVTTNSVTPRQWQFPDPANWSMAPLAGFPTYTFKVRNSQGLNAAFPISGVPVGLALANSSTASGAVTLTDAHTYGLDDVRFEDSFARWRRDNREVLARNASLANHPKFVRLVTRVYVVKEFNVSLTHDGASSGGITAGAAKPVDLFSAETTNLLANYSNSISTINRFLDLASAAAPGGALSLAAASSRTISLKESFARPLVVGYLANEYQILANGKLGPALSTREILEHRMGDPVEVTRRAIREEEAASGDVASQIVNIVNGYSKPAELQKAVGIAHGIGVLSGGEAGDVMKDAPTDLKGSRIKFKDYLFDYASAGSVANRSALRQLLDDLTRGQR